MNINAVKNVITSKLSRQLLVGQKNSPTILFGAGVIGVVATVVLASRATLKLEDVLDETQEKVSMAKALHESGHKDYSDADYKRDLGVLYVRSAGSIVKLYAPSIAVGVLSIGSLAGSHHILNKRNAGLAAAYAAVQKGFAEYRDRVLNEVGEEKERELRYGSETREILEETKKGEPKVKQVKHVGNAERSIYARFFDNRSKDWSPQPEYNMMFLRGQQNWANDRLHAKGHIFLNEVYDGLGIERSVEGQVVGWVKNNGDNFVDFGIFNGENPEKFFDFMTGREGAILLDFNVDGVVYDLI